MRFDVSGRFLSGILFGQLICTLYVSISAINRLSSQPCNRTLAIISEIISEPRWGKAPTAREHFLEGEGGSGNRRTMFVFVTSEIRIRYQLMHVKAHTLNVKNVNPL